MRWLALGIVLLGVWRGSLARADIEPGKYAPDIEAKDWLNSEGPVSLKDMRGLVVVLYFWVSFHEAGEVFIESVNILHNHRVLGRNRGVMVIGVTDADRKRIEPVITREKATFPVALESESYKEFGIESFPRVVVIDPQGKVVQSGSPGDANQLVRRILDLLESNPPSRTRPQEARVVQRRLAEARTALREQDYLRAYRAARTAIDNAVTGDPLKTEVLDLFDLLDLMGRQRLGQAEAAIDEERFAPALEHLRWVIRNLSGSDVARDAKRRLSAIKKKHPQINELLKGEEANSRAAKLLGQARDALLGERFGEAYDRLQQILSDFRDSEAAPLATSILERMRAHPVVEAELRDHIARRDCERWLADARNYLNSGRRKEAEELLMRVVKTYPDTRYETTAKEMLASLR
jgi:peroxiredoxin